MKNRFETSPVREAPRALLTFPAPQAPVASEQPGRCIQSVSGDHLPRSHLAVRSPAVRSFPNKK
jgi:hypothetical protein